MSVKLGNIKPWLEMYFDSVFEKLAIQDDEAHRWVDQVAASITNAHRQQSEFGFGTDAECLCFLSTALQNPSDGKDDHVWVIKAAMFEAEMGDARQLAAALGMNTPMEFLPLPARPLRSSTQSSSWW